MTKYAKNQHVGFKNAIERVAIVGVSKPLNKNITTNIPGYRKTNKHP